MLGSLSDAEDALQETLLAGTWHPRRSLAGPRATARRTHDRPAPHGRAAVTTFSGERVFATPWRLIPTTANGQPAFACYQDVNGTFRTSAIQVLRFEGNRIGPWINERRAEHGGDILVYGSRTLWNSLLADGLVDELHLLVGAVVLGGGTPIFDAPSKGLTLLEARRSDGSDNVLLRYGTV